MVARWLGLTLVGIVTGLFGGYILGAAAGMVAGALAGGLGSSTGGWGEANIVGGLVWFTAAGAIVGLAQRFLLPVDARRGWWWVLASALVWLLAAAASLVGGVLDRGVDLRFALPAALLFSVVVGTVVLLLISARSSRDGSTPA